MDFLSYEAPRPKAGASRRGDIVLIVPLDPTYKTGLAGALAGQNSKYFLLSFSCSLVFLYNTGQLPGQIIKVLHCLIHLLHAFLRLGRTLIDIPYRPCDLIHSG
jgi:hypothetical protein